MYLAAHDVLIPDHEDIPYEDGLIVYEGDIEEYVTPDSLCRTKVGYFKFCVFPRSDFSLYARMSMTTENEELGQLLLESAKGAQSCVAVNRIEIFPDYRRQGFGLCAMRSILSFAKRTGVETAAVHAWPFLDKEAEDCPKELISLWEQAGFTLRTPDGHMTRWL